MSTPLGLRIPSVRAQQWPEDLLDVAAVRAGGVRPMPFRQFLLKVHSRCNLSCDYCYVYEMADQSWRDQPNTMSPAVVRQAARRIAEHVESHSLDEVRVILHGGEPLMAGHGFFPALAEIFAEEMPAGVRLEFGMQTNGVLLDERYLDVLYTHRIRIGVSLDGTEQANDRHRRYANGNGSYQQVRSALRLLNTGDYRRLFTGILCTIDLNNDPVSTYEALLEFDPPSVDFLLPHGNWTSPPRHRDADPAATPYADWLIVIFDRWYSAPTRETGIRYFEEIINLLLGGASHLESIGLTPVTLIVIETNGVLEQVDSLKAAFDGAPATGLNVFDHSFGEALENPAVVARQLGVDALSETCRACRLRDVCGGGLYPHRYKEGHGFLNPSVYCSDLTKLIDHIRARLAADLDALDRPPV